MSPTAAYVGLAGALAFDYANTAPDLGRSYPSPNPVLENVLGLLLCYDRIYFLCPELCPADMRSLPYVSYLVDTASSDDLMRVYGGPYWRHDFGELVSPSFDDWGESRLAISEASGFERRFDNHSRGIRLYEGLIVSGNAMIGANALLDLAAATLVPASNVDVILSTPAQRAIRGNIEWELIDADIFTPAKRAAAEQLAALRVPNFYGRLGSYHEDLEDLRAHRHAAEFREFLSSVDVDASDGRTLAAEISAMADRRMRSMSDRFLAGASLIQAVALPVGRWALNRAFPMSGTVVGSVAGHLLKRHDKELRADSKWTPFVLDLTRPKQ